eukprot:15750880-Heterocapsa_arctica.AAC.1
MAPAKLGEEAVVVEDPLTAAGRRHVDEVNVLPRDGILCGHNAVVVQPDVHVRKNGLLEDDHGIVDHPFATRNRFARVRRKARAKVNGLAVPLGGLRLLTSLLPRGEQ